MAEPFLSEIRMASFNFAPKGWALANGQFLPINQNQALFALLGTTFGGNGQTTFALPNFQGRVPIHVGNGFLLGQNGGQESHTLSIGELPQHTHVVQALDTGNADSNVSTPANNWFSNSKPSNLYSDQINRNLIPINPQAVTPVGGSQAHTNMQPFLVITFIVALQGIFPSPN
ncbi:Microcystin-dependent protein [Dyadobacter sp. SG02]|uniref:phage tail protein n=1 Tax=Dyadobacter sp. SG02 TaxID=1855291 RepID=UPI0008B70606|nr:tail fiber protein [Dyadobacter sp. SG02]SEJ01412.1 Microcystin-dependent protein [Dyadobacter sp. SG02]